MPREFKTCQSCFNTQHIVMNLADKLRQNNQRQRRPQSTFGTNWKTKQLIPYTIKIALGLTFICNSGIFYVTSKKNQKLFDPKRHFDIKKEYLLYLISNWIQVSFLNEKEVFALFSTG